MANSYGLRDCSTQLPTIYTNSLLTPTIADHVGGVVYINGYPDTCWTVVLGTASSAPVAVTILNSYEKCEECQAAIPPAPTIYKLNDCKKITPSLYTTALLTPGIDTADVVYLIEYPDTCWTVTTTPSGSTSAYTIINRYSTCLECINAIPAPPINVFRLIDCVDPEVVMYSFSEELSNVIGKVVHITAYPTNCLSVDVVQYDNQTTVDVSILVNDYGILQIFDDCQCCLPLPDPAPVKYTRVIPKPDKKYYQILQSQCDIKANIKFADNYYRLYKKLKHGMNSMCDNVDLDSAWIKKQLSDLATINNPTACVITTPVEPIICPEPS